MSGTGSALEAVEEVYHGLSQDLKAQEGKQTEDEQQIQPSTISVATTNEVKWAELDPTRLRQVLQDRVFVMSGLHRSVQRGSEEVVSRLHSLKHDQSESAARLGQCLDVYVERVHGLLNKRLDTLRVSEENVGHWLRDCNQAISASFSALREPDQAGYDASELELYKQRVGLLQSEEAALRQSVIPVCNEDPDAGIPAFDPFQQQKVQLLSAQLHDCRRQLSSAQDALASERKARQDLSASQDRHVQELLNQQAQKVTDKYTGVVKAVEAERDQARQDLQQERDEWASARAALEQRVQSLTDQLATSRRAEQEARVESQHVAQQSNAVARERDGWAQKVGQCEQLLQQFRADLASMTARHEQTQTALDAARSSAETCSQTLGETEEQLRQAQAENARLSAEAAENAQESERARNELREERLKIDGERLKMERARMQWSQDQDGFKRAQSGWALERTMDREEKVKQQVAFNSLQEKYQSLLVTSHRLEDEKSALQAQVTALEKSSGLQRSEFEESKRRWTQRVSALDASLSAARLQLSESHRQFRDKETGLRKDRESLLQNMHSQQEAERKSWQQRAEDYLAQLEALRVQSQKQLVTAEQRIDTLQGQLASKADQVAASQVSHVLDKYGVRLQGLVAYLEKIAAGHGSVGQENVDSDDTKSEFEGLSWMENPSLGEHTTVNSPSERLFLSRLSAARDVVLSISVRLRERLSQQSKAHTQALRDLKTQYEGELVTVRADSHKRVRALESELSAQASKARKAAADWEETWMQRERELRDKYMRAVAELDDAKDSHARELRAAAADHSRELAEMTQEWEKKLQTESRLFEEKVITLKADASVERQKLAQQLKRWNEQQRDTAKRHTESIANAIAEERSRALKECAAKQTAWEAKLARVTALWQREQEVSLQHVAELKQLQEQQTLSEIQRAETDRERSKESTAEWEGKMAAAKQKYLALMQKQEAQWKAEKQALVQQMTELRRIQQDELSALRERQQHELDSLSGEFEQRRKQLSQDLDSKTRTERQQSMQVEREWKERAETERTQRRQAENRVLDLEAKVSQLHRQMQQASDTHKEAVRQLELKLTSDGLHSKDQLETTLRAHHEQQMADTEAAHMATLAEQQRAARSDLQAAEDQAAAQARDAEARIARMAADHAEEVTRLQERLRAASASSVASVDDISRKHRTQLTQLNEQHEQSKTEMLAKHRSERAALQAQLEHAEQVRRDLSAQLSQSQGTSQTLAAGKQQITRELAQAKDRLVAVEAELRTAEAERLADRQAFQKDVLDLENEMSQRLAGWQRENERILDQARDSYRSEAQQQESTYQTRVKELQAALREAEQRAQQQVRASVEQCKREEAAFFHRRLEAWQVQHSKGSAGVKRGQGARRGMTAGQVAQLRKTHQLQLSKAQAAHKRDIAALCEQHKKHIGEVQNHWMDQRKRTRATEEKAFRHELRTFKEQYAAQQQARYGARLQQLERKVAQCVCGPQKAIQGEQKEA